MISGTRIPILPVALRSFQQKRLHTKSVNSGPHIIADPWRPVCEFCPLDDCILPEGGAAGSRYLGDNLNACPVIVAQKAGGTPAAALAGVKEQARCQS
jgi:hypothetical protein